MTLFSQFPERNWNLNFYLHFTLFFSCLHSCYRKVRCHSYPGKCFLPLASFRIFFLYFWFSVVCVWLSRYSCFSHFSCLLSVLVLDLWFVVWHWFGGDSQSSLFQIFLLFVSLFSFWYFHYGYVTSFVVVFWIVYFVSVFFIPVSVFLFVLLVSIYLFFVS